jgi:hypothetical protein
MSNSTSVQTNSRPIARARSWGTWLNRMKNLLAPMFVKELFQRSGIRFLDFERFVLDKMFFPENSKNKQAKKLVLGSRAMPLNKPRLVGIGLAHSEELFQQPKIFFAENERKIRFVSFDIYQGRKTKMPRHFILRAYPLRKPEKAKGLSLYLNAPQAGVKITGYRQTELPSDDRQI